MSQIRAIDLFNNLLKIFNQDGFEYKNLIGDTSLLTYIDEALTAGSTPYALGDFTSLTDTINFTDFLPVQSEENKMYLQIGTYEWLNIELPDTIGKLYTGQSIGSAAGNVKIKLNTSHYWNYFSSGGNDGMKALLLPNSNTIHFYYYKDAWQYALKNTDSDIVIAKDGSVYKGSISMSNLIVNSHGVIGIAGKFENQNVKVIDIGTGAIADAVEYTRRIGEYLIAQMNIQTGSGRLLDWIGKDIFGIIRQGGETDAIYAQRIVDTIFAIKGSPLSIRDILLPYADDVIVQDGVELGMFSDVSFTDFYRNLETPTIVKAAITGINGGLPFFFYVLLDNPDLSKVYIIMSLINNYKVAGTNYDIILI